MLKPITVHINTLNSGCKKIDCQGAIGVWDSDDYVEPIFKERRQSLVGNDY